MVELVEVREEEAVVVAKDHIAHVEVEEELRDEDFVTDDEEDEEEEGAIVAIDSKILAEADEDEEDSDEEDSDEDEDEDDEDILNETLSERILALADIIPPTTRVHIYKSVSRTVSNTLSTLRVMGSVGWVVATSALLVVLPVALEMEREGFTLQQEHAQRMQQQQAQQIAQPAESAPQTA